MVDQTVANLKITVDSTDLTKVNDQLAATGAATDAFNSKLSGTANAAQPARTATQGLANDLNAMAGQTTAASGSFGTLLASIQGFGSGLKSSLFNLQTWRDTWAQMTPAATNLATGTKAATVAVAAHAVEVGHANEASKAWRETVHTLDPAIRQLGVGVEGLNQFTGAARGGIALLASAMAGALLTAIVKINDSLDESSKKIQAFTGSASSTAAAMEKFKDLAKETGVGVGDFADALSKLLQNGPQVALTISGRLVPASEGYIASLKGIADAMAKMGSDTGTTSKVMSDFADSVQRDGTIASSFWTKLATDAPVAAQNLATALGFTKNSMQSATTVMVEFGQRGEISLTQLTRAIQNLSKFTKEGEQSMSQSWGRVVQAWDSLVAALGKDPGVKKAMDVIVDSLDEITKNIEHGTPIWKAGLEFLFYPHWENWDVAKTIFPSVTTAIESMASSAKDAFNSMLTAWQSAWNSMKDFVTNILQSITSTISSWASGIASSIGNALQSAISSAGAAESNLSSGATGDVVQLPPSAEGNLFQISAGGGKDSIRMTGMVSPDEIVAIIPKENASAGLLTHIQAAIGNSPISISPDGQSGTSVSAIAAPSSYAAYEAMSRYGSPALAPGGHYATAVPGGAASVANATAAATARKATGSSAAPANPLAGILAAMGYGGQPSSSDVLSSYLSGPATITYNGVTWSRTKWGGYLPNATVNLGHGPNEADFAHMGGFTYNDTGGGASSAASSVSRVGSAAQASQAAASAAGITDDQIRKDLEAKLTGAGTVADQMSRNAASLPAAPIAQPVQGPNLPSTVTAPEGQTVNNPYYNGGGGVPLPPEAPGYNPPTEQDQLAAMYQEMGYNSDTGLDFGDTSASTNVYSADQGYTGIPESYTGSMGAENMGDFGASLGDPGSADLSYDTGSDYTAGDFATGGGFTVPFGSNGADSVRVRLNASGGERIRVDRPGEPDDTRIGGSTKGKRDSAGDTHFHFYGVTDAGSFQASRTALMRFAQQAASS